MQRNLIALFAILAASPAWADCNAIRDYDRRQACFAEQRQDPRDCTSIKNWDDREVCRQRAGQTDMFGRSSQVRRNPWN